MYPADWPRLRETRLRALQESPLAFARSFPEEEVQPRSFWEARATPNDDRANFAAIEDEEWCGMVGVVRDRDAPTLAHLVGMWVAPAHRRRGVGRMLVRAVVDWTRGHGISDLELGVNEENEAAIRLYAEEGFVLTSERQPLASNPSVTEVTMRLVIPQHKG